MPHQRFQIKPFGYASSQRDLQISAQTCVLARTSNNLFQEVQGNRSLYDRLVVRMCVCVCACVQAHAPLLVCTGGGCVSLLKRAANHTNYCFQLAPW